MEVEILKQLEFLFGSIGVTLSIFFTVLLINSKKKSNLFLAIYLIVFALRIGKSLFHNYYDISPILRTHILNLMFAIGPSIWLFTKYSISSKKEILTIDWLHYLVVLLMFPLCWFIPNDGSSILFPLFYNAIILHFSVYLMFTILYFFKSKKSSNTNKNERIETWIFRFLLGNLIFLLWYTLISFGIISFYIGISFFYSILVILFGFWSMKTPELLSVPKLPKAKYKDSLLSIDEAEKLFGQIKTILNEEKLYLDSSLTLKKLSNQLNASPKEVSQAINQIEKLNYAQFISTFRVEEAKRLLLKNIHL